MRITNKLIEEVVSSVAGQDTVPLILAIKDKKNVSEFKIAEMLEEQINITRNMLYRLLDQNLVHFIRKKDRQKGWYIYYWTFNQKQIRFLTIKLQKQRLQKLKERLEREESAQFFTCPQGCIRLDFEHAMNFEFKCPECGNIIEQHDNLSDIEKIKKTIVEIEDFLKIELAPIPPKILARIRAENEREQKKEQKAKSDAMKKERKVKSDAMKKEKKAKAIADKKTKSEQKKATKKPKTTKKATKTKKPKTVKKSTTKTKTSKPKKPKVKSKVKKLVTKIKKIAKKSSKKTK